MHLCFVCIYVCVRVSNPLEVIDNCELPCGYQELNPSPFERLPRALDHWAISLTHKFWFLLWVKGTGSKSTTFLISQVDYFSTSERRSIGDNEQQFSQMSNSEILKRMHGRPGTPCRSFSGYAFRKCYFIPFVLTCLSVKSGWNLSKCIFLFYQILLNNTITRAGVAATWTLDSILNVNT